MLITILLTVLPSLLLYPLLRKITNNTYLILSFSWFCGQFIITLLIFLSTLMLSLKFSGALQKTEFIISLSLVILLFINLKKIIRIKKYIKFNKQFLFKLFILLFVLLFSYLFYAPHLKINNGIIYTSPVYWDFKWHAPLIQNFAYGDNFPPQNESFSGMPQTYHFFWGFLVSIYDIAGLDIVSAINLISILSLFFLLTSVIGLSEEFFKSTIAGIISVLLIITSSSLHFIHYFISNFHGNLISFMTGIITNTNNPYFFSFINGNPYAYNGTMTNMFYFLAERQMVIGIIFLLFFVFIIYKRSSMPNNILVIIGILMGTFFLWHLYITIMVICSFCFLLIFDNNRKKTLILFLPFGLIFFLNLVYFRQVTDSIWFTQDIKSFPKLNFNFSTMDWEYNSSIFNVLNIINYYSYAYGIKLIFILIGLIFLRNNNKKAFIIFLSIIIPSLILINTIQLSPLSIYDNHKWLRPMNFIIDLLTGFTFYKVFIFKKSQRYLYLGVLPFILLTLSGFIELMPFLNSKPNNKYAVYTSPLIKKIRQQTKPKSVFLSPNIREIQLAGRKVFLGDYSGQELGLNTNLRKKIINDIYYSKNITYFCGVVKKYNIDYVEGDISKALNNNSIIKFTSPDGEKQKRSFVDVYATCKN